MNTTTRISQKEEEKLFTALASEKALAKGWESKEDSKVWKNLQDNPKTRKSMFGIDKGMKWNRETDRGKSKQEKDE